MRPSRNPRAAQEAPKELQRPMQKIAKQNPQKCLHGKKCLKPAISFLTNCGTNFPAQICTLLKHILHNCLTTFSKNVGSHFGTQFGIRAAQEGQDEPKRTIRSFKEPKTFIFKNLKKPFCFLKVFGYRGPSRKPQEAEEGSQKAPKKSKTPKKWNPKLKPKIIKNWNPFWSPL